MKGNLAEEVKGKYKLIEYAQEMLEGRLGRSGSSYFINPCPACGHNDCCSIHTEKDFFKCFSCGAGGSVIDLHMMNSGLEFREALRELASRCGITLGRDDYNKWQEIDKARERAVAHYHAALLADKDAMKYLLGPGTWKDVRLLSEEIIKKEKIGLADGKLIKALEGEGFSKETLQATGLVSQKGGDYWKRDLILFPQFFRGRLSHYSAKDYKTGKKAYQARKGDRHPDCQFYGQDALYKNKEIFWVEGEIDRLQVMSLIGLENVVCINGNLFDEQIAYINRPEFRSMTHYLVFDMDEPGLSYRAALMEKGDFSGWDVRSVSLPYGKDIDELLVKSRSPKKMWEFIVRTAERYSDDRFRVSEENGFLSVWRPGGRGENAKPYKARVANFTMKLHRKISRPDGINRVVQLVSEYGERSNMLTLKPDEMLSLQKFRSKMVGEGNFVFEGKEADLSTLWQYWMSMETGNLVYEEDHIGYLAKHDAWLFGNLLISKGRVIEVDDEGVAWDMDQGFVPALRSFETQKGAERAALPQLRQHDKSLEELIEFLDLLLENTGTYGSWLLLGWFFACAYGPEIYRKYGYFPIAFLYGKAQSGKNTLARLCARTFGLKETDFVLIPEATEAGLSRLFSYYSEIPLVVDEYRSSDPRSTSKDGLFRGLYNRTSPVKAERDNSLTTRQVMVRSMLLLLGEQTPRDMAFSQRCLLIRLQEGKRKDDLLKELERRSYDLSGFLVEILRRKHGEGSPTPTIMKYIQVLEERLVMEGRDSRTATCYAIPGAVLNAILGKGARQEAFNDWLLRQSGQEHEGKRAETPVMRFFEEVLSLLIRGQVSDKAFHFERADEDQRRVNEGLMGWGWVAFPPVYQIYAEHCRKMGLEAWPKNNLLDQVKDELFFVCDHVKRFPDDDNRPKRAIKLEINTKITPRDVAALFGCETGDVEPANRPARAKKNKAEEIL